MDSVFRDVSMRFRVVLMTHTHLLTHVARRPKQRDDVTMIHSLSFRPPIIDSAEVRSLKGFASISLASYNNY